MKKIIFVTSKIHGGGSENVLKLISENFANLGYKISIIILDDSKSKIKSNNKINYFFYKGRNSLVNNKVILILKKIFFIRSLIKNHKPDVVFSFITETNVLAIISCILLKCKIITSERNDIEKQKKSKVWVLLSYIFYRFSDVITANSNKSVNLLKKKFKDKNIKFLPNPVKEIKRLKIKKKKIILCVAKFEKQKDHETLIKAFSSGKFYRDGWILKLIGEGSLKEKIKNDVRKLNISDFVDFKPYCEDLSKEMSQAFMIVLPSKYEGMPNIILESALFKIPFIISDSCDEVIRIFGKKNIVTFADNNLESLKIALSELIKSKKTRIQTNNNYDTMIKNFNNVKINKYWERIIFN